MPNPTAHLSAPEVHEASALVEADRFLEGGERVLGDALLFGDDRDVREAGEHMVVMCTRARRFIALVRAGTT
jgi:hypothetical protein